MISRPLLPQLNGRKQWATVNYFCFGGKQPGSSWHQKTYFLGKGTEGRNKLILGSLKGVGMEERECQQQHVFKIFSVASMGIVKALSVEPPGKGWLQQRQFLCLSCKRQVLERWVQINLVPSSAFGLLLHHRCRHRNDHNIDFAPNELIF